MGYMIEFPIGSQGFALNFGKPDGIMSEGLYAAAGSSSDFMRGMEGGSDFQ